VTSLTGDSQSEVEKGSETVAIEDGKTEPGGTVAEAGADDDTAAEKPAEPELRDAPELTEDEIAEMAAELVGDQPSEPSAERTPSDS